MSLPGPLAELLSVLVTWSTPDLSVRFTALGAATDADLEVLAGRVLSRLDEIDAYLDSAGGRDPGGPAAALMRLVECAHDARAELEMRAGSLQEPGPDS